MKVTAIHDAEGNIARLLVRPANAPMGSPATPPPGHLATEVDIAGLKLDATDPKDFERLVETMRDYRIEVKAATGKLVRKRGGKAS
jgi:hypothetical protein